jgi:hypothetical protein
MTRVRTLAVLAVVLGASATRLVPHPPNVTPIAAMALFGGAQLRDRRLAVGLPLAAMLASDLVLGLHPLLPAVYLSVALIVGLGIWVGRRPSVVRIAAATLAGAVLFFVITNFAVWAWGGLYPRTLAGLVAAYVAALPFFRATLLGDAAYVLLLFGGFALLTRGSAALRAPSPTGLRSAGVP